MAGKTISYRGYLKSCNYSCSYCPFSKHRASASELEKDRRSFERFCDSVENRAAEFSVGAVFVVPYGEASLHRWYWEGLGRLAALPEIHRVGLQTNLSFSVENCLEIFDFSSAARGGSKLCSLGGKRDKLCIWATFHPEMTDVDSFSEKCRRLVESGVRLCAGAVGVPQNLPLLTVLREKLPPDVYLWINRMDGLKRNYTEEEKAAFSAIDPFFERELNAPRADLSMCTDRCFVEADGGVRSCNIGRTKEVNWYQGSAEEIFGPLCGKKRCSCYLAYGGRADFAGRAFFGDYPVFRIPQRYSAIFLDLDGTLVPEGHRGGLPEGTRRRLAALGEKCPVFLATSMPKEEAWKRLGGDRELFRGAVFASGGYVLLRESREETKADREAGGCGEESNVVREDGTCRETVHSLEAVPLSGLTEFAERVRARVRIYRKNHQIYKITLIKRHHCPWREQECERVRELLAQSGCRVFTENNCLQIIGEGLDKGVGVREICGWLGIPPEETLSVGNDREDEAMGRVCGAYLRIPVFGEVSDCHFRKNPI